MLCQLSIYGAHVVVVAVAPTVQYTCLETLIAVDDIEISFRLDVQFRTSRGRRMMAGFSWIRMI